MVSGVQFMVGCVGETEVASLIGGADATEEGAANVREASAVQNSGETDETSVVAGLGEAEGASVTEGKDSAGDGTGNTKGASAEGDTGGVLGVGDSTGVAEGDTVKKGVLIEGGMERDEEASTAGGKDIKGMALQGVHGNTEEGDVAKAPDKSAVISVLVGAEEGVTDRTEVVLGIIDETAED